MGQSDVCWSWFGLVMAKGLIIATPPNVPSSSLCTTSWKFPKRFWNEILWKADVYLCGQHRLTSFAVYIGCLSDRWYQSYKIHKYLVACTTYKYIDKSTVVPKGIAINIVRKLRKQNSIEICKICRETDYGYFTSTVRSTQTK